MFKIDGKNKAKFKVKAHVSAVFQYKSNSFFKRISRISKFLSKKLFKIKAFYKSLC